MWTRSSSLRTLFCLLMSLPSNKTQAQDPALAKPISVPPGTNLKDPAALLSFATSVNGLDDGDPSKLTPWHLKASYETFDDDGKSSGIGTFEEWHIAGDQWKRSYVGTHFTQTEYQSKDGHFYGSSAGAAPWPESLIEQELVDPMPGKREKEDASLEIKDQTFGKVRLACIMLPPSDSGVKWPLGLFPTYCFGTDTGILRFGAFDGSIQAIMNRPAIFEGRYVAQEIELKDDAKLLLRIHMLSLNNMSADAALVSPPDEVRGTALAHHPTSSQDASSPSTTANPIGLRKVIIASGVMAGNRVRGVAPNYPVEAKENHIQGRVILRAEIGTDGRIHRLRIASSPDKSLSIASVVAVERWVYRPYLLNGEPVSVDTTINVVFNLGR